MQEVGKEYVGDEKRKKIKNEIKRYRKLLVSLTHEPAYRFGDDYRKVDKGIEAPN
jgi:hypothetical protein